MSHSDCSLFDSGWSTVSCLKNVLNVDHFLTLCDLGGWGGRGGGSFSTPCNPCPGITNHVYGWLPGGFVFFFFMILFGA